MQALTDIRNLYLALLLSAVFMTAGCDDDANRSTSSGPVVPPTVLALHLCVQLDEVTDLESLKARLNNEGDINRDDDEMVWLPLAPSNTWINSDTDRTLITNDPEAFFAGLNMVGTKHGENCYVLVWNALDKSLSQRHENWTIDEATSSADAMGNRAVLFRLNTAGGDYMRQLTSNHKGRALAIVLNDRVKSAPIIQSTISRNGIISGGHGGFSEIEAEEIIRLLNSAR